MAKYCCDNHKKIDADIMASWDEIARRFAEIKARKMFGKRGVVGAFQIDGWMSDYSMFYVNAFIGVKQKKCNAVDGRNIRFQVHIEK